MSVSPQELRELLVAPVHAGKRCVSVHAPRRPDLGVIDLAVIAESGRGTALAMKRAQILELIDRLHEVLEVLDGQREPMAHSATETPAGRDTAPAAYSGERTDAHGWDAPAVAARWRED